jgi:hypothetical protein
MSKKLLALGGALSLGDLPGGSEKTLSKRQCKTHKWGAQHKFYRACSRCGLHQEKDAKGRFPTN